MSVHPVVSNSLSHLAPALADRRSHGSATDFTGPPYTERGGAPGGHGFREFASLHFQSHLLRFGLTGPSTRAPVVPPKRDGSVRLEPKRDIYNMYIYNCL